MKRIILSLVVILLSGCASLPKKIDDFYTGNYNVRNLSSNFSVKDTHDLLFRELVACYQGERTSLIPIPGAMVKVSQASYVEYNIKSNGTRLLALVGEAGWNRFYQQLIEIKKTENNSTLVQVYEVSSGWEKHTARIDSWLKGQDAEGCGLW